MTLKEIAALAGVSPSTVSRVINHPGSKAASKEVENRIWKIIRETGYTPDTSARNLKLRSAPVPNTAGSKAIGCILARTHTTDPFFSKITRGLEREALRSGYTVKYIFSYQDIENPDIQEAIQQTKVEGVALLGRPDSRMRSFLKTNYKKIIYAGLNNIDSEFDQITCNAYLASKTAVSYLAELGHTHIAYLGERKNEIRYRGYWDAVSQLALPLHREYIIDTHLSSEDGYRAAAKLFASADNITALFCANDLTAIGAMKAAKEWGYRIPEDMSIIGIDDIETCQYTTPMLTTIHIPMEDLGIMTAKILIDRIETGKRIPMKVELPFRLIKRGSCAAPPFKQAPRKKQLNAKNPTGIQP
jgi:DNA-binding LacI/PurR family transcriptional regulator